MALQMQRGAPDQGETEFAGSELNQNKMHWTTNPLPQLYKCNMSKLYIIILFHYIIHSSYYKALRRKS